MGSHYVQVATATRGVAVGSVRAILPPGSHVGIDVVIARVWMLVTKSLFYE